MSIAINAKGTTVPYFKIGKGGVTLYQGSIDPNLIYTMVNGDFWLDTTRNSLEMWSSTASDWAAPRLADLTFDGTTINALATDLTLQTNGNNAKVVFKGDVGPGIITASASQDLFIDPSLGGGGDLILVDNQWPAADGTANQVLTTDGSGILSFTTLNRIGSPAPATNATTGHGYIPVTSGTPTGTPAAITGYVPIVADSGGTKLWVYVGGSWKYATLT